jgi:hypothetical protein
MKRFYWKVWLRLNLLTKEVDNDYTAEVSTVGKTLHNTDIARIFEESGSELQYETLLDILDRADRIRREKLQEGYSVQTGVCHHSPRVSGNWQGAGSAYDPNTHKITLTSTITTEMRAALEEVGVEVLGIRDSGAYIGLVTDVTTGAVDGTITSGGQIIIKGDKIKVESDTEDPDIGVFLTDGTTDYPVTPLAVNHPREIIAIAPVLYTGEYTLYILTRYAGSKTRLKEPRRITYKTTIKVN